MSLLLCDVGNSRIKIALADHEQSIQIVDTYPTVQAEEAGAKILELARDMPIGICSVVVKASEVIKSKINRPVFEVRSDKQQEIGNLYSGFGVDRLADIIAAKRIYAKGNNFLVIGLGTATVLTTVSSSSEFAGGFITLGMVSTLNALKARIPVLPEVSPNGCNANLGANVLESIGNGTLLAQAACVDRWIEEAKKKFDNKMVTIATGGCLEFIAKYTRSIDHFDPMLTLKGTYILAKEEVI